MRPVAKELRREAAFPAEKKTAENEGGAGGRTWTRTMDLVLIRDAL